MNPNIKLVIHALIESVAPVLNVMMFGLIINIIFAIIGYNLFSGLLGYCSSMHDYYSINKEKV